ncbi:hypothetical protein [Kitasatospora sp. MAP5-34]|uniref:hypothetical protein n=1 Tax=Kitasatospora sp. MAP5-34 TaxID=3035102 RepID=UPI002474FD08|nr:hypothetical protein [Kitasatospora sp. MAP5-34]MDH6580245.1 hypothetical protein [Kitasatospora sp. MAP5-34]
MTRALIEHARKVADDHLTRTGAPIDGRSPPLWTPASGTTGRPPRGHLVRIWCKVPE